MVCRSAFGLSLYLLGGEKRSSGVCRMDERIVTADFFFFAVIDFLVFVILSRVALPNGAYYG